MSFMEDTSPSMMDPGKYLTSFTTCIDNRFSVKNIANFNKLPKKMRDEIASVNEIRSHGFQELVGYKDRHTMFSCGGYWITEKNPDPHGWFVVTSYGSHTCQWDGETLRSTVQVYV